MKSMLLFAALISIPHHGAKASGGSADEKAIKAAQVRLLAAMNAKSVDRVKPLFTKGFVMTANGMTFNRDQAAAQLVQGSRSTKMDWTMSGLSVHGANASYASQFTFQSKMVDSRGMVGLKGASHKVVVTGAQKLQMVKESGKWLYSRLAVESTAMSMDGKPFNPQSLGAGMRR